LTPFFDNPSITEDRGEDNENDFSESVPYMFIFLDQKKPLPKGKWFCVGSYLRPYFLLMKTTGRYSGWISFFILQYFLSAMVSFRAIDCYLASVPNFQDLDKYFH